VVAGDNPHFPIAFDHDLRGSEDVTSGMKRDADVADRDRLTPRLGLDDAIRESVTEQRRAFGCAEIRVRSGARVITVRMRDDRALDGLPGIDMEVAGFAVQTGRGGTDHA